MDDVQRFLSEELVRERLKNLREKGLVPSEDTVPTVTEAGEPEGITITAVRRFRYWTDGLIIGSRRFVLETAAVLRSPEELARHRLQPLRTGATTLFSFRRLRNDLRC